MKLLFTLLAFALALGVLIVVHELGHYWAARLCGVKVLRFSIGFGKPFWLRRFGRDRTEWAIAAFPLGGYVKMLDEHEGEVAAHELPRAFNRQPVSRRFIIAVAGPLANLLLAVLLYWALFVHGVTGLKAVVGEPPRASPAAAAGFVAGETISKVGATPVATWQDVNWALLQQAFHQGTVEVEARDAGGAATLRTLDLTQLDLHDMSSDLLQELGLVRFQPVLPAVVGQVLKDSVAEHAGISGGDQIVSINGQPVSRWDQVVDWVRVHPGQPLEFEIKRGNALQQLKLVPQAVTENGASVGKIGVAPRVSPDVLRNLVVEVSYSPGAGLLKALDKTWETSLFSLRTLGRMIIGAVSLKNLSGPITIADYAGQSAQVGVAAYLGFLALLSVSLGVLNLLPIPLLDGGHLMYYTVEIIKGSPVSDSAIEIGQRLGMALLITLMLFAIYNDISRLLGG